MYQFRKKFRRSNVFFYNNMERKGNTQKDDANSSVSYESQFFEQENEFGDLNEQSEDIAENYDKHQELTTKTQHLLLDGYSWILCCSCDANRKQFVEALPNNIQLDPQKESTSMMQSLFSDHSYHEMQPEEVYFGM
ncbi:uncharacterized protein LOC124459188 isoform X2 [Xenia sp. Carnegie-2017]|uniref:uncharacterized protein LOC124459188 isoform X2 n=1 Tax=Xenia sp. Carnegie-2017 TaxID=2897299 RepID=UPI001F03FB17|nr:uncharacterized protein LOC124459188 isoform X2 [Xenia sp. Carnegie-2017]